MCSRRRDLAHITSHIYGEVVGIDWWRGVGGEQEEEEDDNDDRGEGSGR